MAPGIKGILGKLGAAVNSKSSAAADGFEKPPKSDGLFPKTNPAVDGEECLHDCSTCTIKYPKKFSIEKSDPLYGHVKGWSTHLVVATGKSDWVRDVADEKGSVMEAVDKAKYKPSNGRVMISASNIPLSYCVPPNSDADPRDLPTSVLLLPAFQFIDNVTPATTPDLLRYFVDVAPTNTTPLGQQPPPSASPANDQVSLTRTVSSQHGPPSGSSPPDLQIRPCPHKYLILLCSQKTRDARCGQSAPLLRREFERHLRPLGLYRDLDDERPGGCGIYFISHVGGHKYSANVLVYRRGDAEGIARPDGAGGGQDSVNEGKKQAAQCIWLARVRPEHCENLVRYTVLQGKVVKPEEQLRGGFDRSRQLVSW